MTLFLISCEREKQYRSLFGDNLRFDGYYMFDNGIDTFSLLPNGKELYQEVKAFSLRTGLPIGGYTNNECAPKGVLYDGNKSSFQAYLVFFQDTAGAAATGNCHAPQNLDFLARDFLQEKRKYLSTSKPTFKMLSSVIPTSDSTALLKNNSKIPMLAESYACKFMRDSIEVTMVNDQYPESKNLKNARRMYYFHPDARFQ